MIIAIVLVAAAALSLLAIVGTALARRLQTSAEGSLADQICLLDVEAFRNLADPGEEEYLRGRLPDAEYRKVRRARLHALAGYVQTAGKNAAALAVMGQNALSSEDAATVEAARRLVEQAVLLRRNAGLLLVRIYADRLWPTSNLGAAPILDRYNRVSGAAMLLGRLQNPAAAVRIAIR